VGKLVSFPTWFFGPIVVVIIWYLDLQLPMQSMLITTKNVSSNPIHGWVYSIQHYVIKFVSDFSSPVSSTNKTVTDVDTLTIV
jgi:hypothetical protein